jgi:hypothetical protein
VPRVLRVSPDRLELLAPRALPDPQALMAQPALQVLLAQLAPQEPLAQLAPQGLAKSLASVAGPS